MRAEFGGPTRNGHHLAFRSVQRSEQQPGKPIVVLAQLQPLMGHPIVLHGNNFATLLGGCE